MLKRHLQAMQDVESKLSYEAMAQEYFEDSRAMHKEGWTEKKKDSNPIKSVRAFCHDLLWAHGLESLKYSEDDSLTYHA